MQIIKTILAAAVALAVISLGGTAQAEVISYEFSADITEVGGNTGILNLTTDSVVSGTFTYDSSTNESFWTNIWSPGVAEIQSDATANLGAVVQSELGDSSFSDNNILMVTDVDWGTVESIILSGDTSSGSINLATDLSGAEYSISVYTGFDSGYAKGSITSLSRIGSASASSVPELSAKGTVTSVALLAGATIVLSTRRQQAASAQS